jgi:hypothetical protein
VLVVVAGAAAVGDGASGLKLEPLVAAGPGLAAVIATPITIGTTVISAATSASIAGQRRLRPAPEGDGLVEVIFWPLLVGEIDLVCATRSAGWLLIHQR